VRRSIEPWVAEPLDRFVAESGARVVLLMTSAGQVVAQHGFTRALDVMSAAALGAGIIASTSELGQVVGGERFGALVHQGTELGVYLAPLPMPEGQWIGLVVFGRDTSIGLVQLFFSQLATTLAAQAPVRDTGPVLAEDFEADLNASLRALFGE